MRQSSHFGVFGSVTSRTMVPLTTETLPNGFPQAPTRQNRRHVAEGASFITYLSMPLRTPPVKRNPARNYLPEQIQVVSVQGWRLVVAEVAVRRCLSKQKT